MIKGAVYVYISYSVKI